MQFTISVYTLLFTFSETARKEYFDVFNGYPLVDTSDVFFGVHAVIITALTIMQTIVYSDHDGRSHVKLAYWSRVFMLLSIFGMVVLSVDVLYGHALLIDVLYYLSGVKMVITVIKYTPQVLQVLWFIVLGVLELQERIHGWMEYQQHCIGSNGRSVFNGSVGVGCEYSRIVGGSIWGTLTIHLLTSRIRLNLDWEWCL
jgi:hypothetical protein